MLFEFDKMSLNHICPECIFRCSHGRKQYKKKRKMPDQFPYDLSKAVVCFSLVGKTIAVHNCFKMCHLHEKLFKMVFYVANIRIKRKQ